MSASDVSLMQMRAAVADALRTSTMKLDRTYLLASLPPRDHTSTPRTGWSLVRGLKKYFLDGRLLQ